MTNKLLRASIILGLLIFVSGTLILLLNSSIQDIGLTVISIGGLFSIWFKIGCLESETKELARRISAVEHNQEKILGRMRGEDGQSRSG